MKYLIIESDVIIFNKSRTWLILGYSLLIIRMIFHVIDQNNRVNELS